jgi:hypothetical protein
LPRFACCPSATHTICSKFRRTSSLRASQLEIVVLPIPPCVGRA